MNWLKRLFHTHQFEEFVTDRFVEKDTVVTKFINTCECGEIESIQMQTVGKLFRNRKIEEEL